VTLQVDFYQMGGRFADPLTVTALLVSKAWPKLEDIAIIADAEQLNALDETLWSTPSGRFFPHALDDDTAPIRLLTNAPPKAQLLINLNPDAPLPDGDFDRVCELVPATDQAREPLRERWRAWQARGATLNHHALK
jgi:DNA polymerase-3 subunit chi